MTPHSRLIVLQTCITLLLCIVIGRLFYWQIIKSSSLRAEAQNQYQKSVKVSGSRGRMFTQDGKVLVGNEKVYRLFLEPPLITSSSQEIVDALMPVLTTDLEQFVEATDASKLKTDLEDYRLALITKVEERKDARWVGLVPQISQQARDQLKAKNIAGLGFESYEVRYYPEASMAAQLTGFVGKDAAGYDLGYFGIEGALEKELQQRSFIEKIERGLLGFIFKHGEESSTTSGRDVVLSIRRDIQFLLEEKLAWGLKKYGAKAGEIIVLEPSTGKILGAASLPRYDQKKFYEYEPQLYKNPIVTHVYEPGSTFKIITVAAGIDSGAIKPDTTCERCEGPIQMGKYTIKTWNNEYHPDITMTEALAKSDNVAMVFAAETMGSETLENYVKKFGIGSATTTDLQEDTDTPFPQKWGPVETATISFGQGISTTSLQLVRAVSAVANGGVMMQPMLVEKVIDPASNQELLVKPQVKSIVIKPETAADVTKMMVNAAQHGEAQWISDPNHTIAGKTGTAQIAVDGKYDPDKTIASFVGFPASNPKFVMLVKLIEPESSIWAAETAAPLWYNIAEELYLMLNVPPDK